MDRIPPNLPTNSSRLIAMAVTLVGEAQSVMLEMKSSHQDFLEYCAGLKEPPPEEFSRLIELLVIEQRKMVEKNRELIARIRERHNPPD